MKRGAKVVKIDEQGPESPPITSVTEESVARLMDRVLAEYPSLRLRIASEQLAAMVASGDELSPEHMSMALEMADLLIQREAETR
jgi:hypothetical protein